MQKLISLLCFFIFSFSIQAEVKIDSKNHIQNDNKGRCVWASIETLGITNGWDEVKDWTKNHPYPLSCLGMIEELTKAKIKFKAFRFENKEFYYYVKKDNKTYKILDNKKEADDLIIAKGKDWIHVKIQQWDKSFFENAIKRDLGAIAVIRYIKALHAVVITDISTDKVKFIDSNTQPGVVREEDLEWFLDKWVGFAVVLEKK